MWRFVPSADTFPPSFIVNVSSIESIIEKCFLKYPRGSNKEIEPISNTKPMQQNGCLQLVLAGGIIDLHNVSGWMHEECKRERYHIIATSSQVNRQVVSFQLRNVSQSLWQRESLGHKYNNSTVHPALRYCIITYIYLAHNNVWPLNILLSSVDCVYLTPTCDF